jgi:hypothetical protein
VLINARTKEKTTMFKKRSLLVPASLIFIGLGVSTAGAAPPQPQCFILASIQGSWATVGAYGANVALGIGQRVIDASGVMTGVYVLNAPTVGDTTGARTVSNGTQAGTYTINCDGRGTVTRTTTSTLGGGTVVAGMDDFIVTGAEVKNGQLIATSLLDVQQTPSALVPGGIFLFRHYTRLPDRPGPTIP